MDYSDASGCLAETLSSPWPPCTTSLDFIWISQFFIRLFVWISHLVDSYFNEIFWFAVAPPDTTSFLPDFNAVIRISGFQDNASPGFQYNPPFAFFVRFSVCSLVCKFLSIQTQSNFSSWFFKVGKSWIAEKLKSFRIWIVFNYNCSLTFQIFKAEKSWIPEKLKSLKI